MSLFEDSASDLRDIMNSDIGATRSCTVTDPSGDVQTFACRVSDISQQIDPSTNQMVIGRQIVMSINLADLKEADFDGIMGVESNLSKPWKVTVDNVLDVSETYKVVVANPDYTLGNMSLILESIR